MAVCLPPCFMCVTMQSMASLRELYLAHIARLSGQFEQAMAATGHHAVVIHAGRLRYEFLDDRPYAFKPNPWFKHWLPLTEHADCWLIIRPGSKPVLVYHQPDDYWHAVPEGPHGYWVDCFDIVITRELFAAKAQLPVGPGVAIIGEGSTGLEGVQVNNPQALIDRIHYLRASKSDYELELMRRASRLAVRGHRAAEAAFRAEASEYEIHQQYLLAMAQVEQQLPYGNIIALNQHAAILHYQHQQISKPLQHLSFLIDAGAQVSGYAADITRTYARHEGYFADLIQAVNAIQLELVDMVRVGTDYRQIHLATHLKLAQLLQRLGLVRMAPESQVESGVSGVFFPHGIGHLLGLQVHDVAGFTAPDGSVIAKPQGHPYLRLTRELSADMVLTIEPGLYFIDSLLKTLADGPHAGDVAWSEIDALRHYGGIRIEDDVRVRAEGAPENLTRDAFAEVI